MTPGGVNELPFLRNWRHTDEGTILTDLNTMLQFELVIRLMFESFLQQNIDSLRNAVL